MEFDFYSDAEKKRQERELRRRKLLRGVRGWLHDARHPRQQTAILLALSLATGAGVALLARQVGMTSVPTLCFLGVLAAWPVFLGLVRWRGRQLVSQLDATGDMRRFLMVDEKAEYTEYWKGHEGGRVLDDAFTQGVARGGGGGAIGLLALGFFSLGTWLLWDLTREGPTLFAEAVVDDALPHRHPQLTANLHNEAWLPNAFAGTAPHFGGLAICFAGLALVVRLFAPAAGG